MNSVADTAKRHYFEGAGARLSALSWGSSEQPCMVILHGIRDLAWSMASLTEHFAGRYFVIAPDLRGHGESQHAGSYAMPHFVADIVALYRHFGIDQATIVAHSLGGHIAAQYASLFPDTVNALVMLDGMGPPSNENNFTPQMLAQHATNDVQALLQKPSAKKAMASLQEVQQRLARNNPKLDQQRLQLLAEQGSYQQNEAFYWKWDARANEFWSTLHPQLNPKRWLLIDCPVLLVHGDEAQNYWNQMGMSLTQQDIVDDYQHRRQWFSNASVTTVDNASHMLHYDAPEQTNQVVDGFLQSLS